MIIYICLNTKTRNEVILLNEAKQYVAKKFFQNRILTYNGKQFEDFFVSIMTKSNPSFYPVKAYGNIGDEKNDGFDRTTGTYYQVFAPENLHKDKTIYDAVKKLENDFKGLYEHWSDTIPIKKFYFVVNDKNEGLPSPIYKAIIKLDKDYKDISINPFTAKDLEKIFDLLDWDSKQDIIGFIPDGILPVVEIDALSETVSHLMKVEIRRITPDSLLVPDFDEKIVFNGLSDVVKNTLVTGSYQENILIEFFNANPGIREILQKKFHELYSQAKEDISDDQENSADSRFYYILEKACYKNTFSIQSSVIILMTYYFSSCDIFEEPK